jgi:hypothetical protein
MSVMAVERCGRCGTARRGDLQICVRCETPFGTPDGDPDVDIQRPAAPSTMQTHGTMAAMLVVGVVLFGVVLAFSGRDVGPFTARITGQRPAAAANTVTVTIEVTNEGDRAGRGNCRVQVRSANNIASTARTFLTERRIPGNASVTQDVDVSTADGQPADVACS